MLKISILLILVVLIAYSFIGCGFTQTTTTSPIVSSQTVEPVAVYTPSGEVNDFVYFSSFLVSTEQADIFYDVNITSEDRQQMTQSIEEMTAFIDFEEKIIYRISDSFGTWIDEGIIYINQSEFYTDFRYACMTLLFNYGEQTNYGLVYGYANYLLNESATINDQDLTDITENSTSIFDLTWPLFLGAYVTSEDGERVREISTEFVLYLIESITENGFE